MECGIRGLSQHNRVRSGLHVFPHTIQTECKLYSELSRPEGAATNTAATNTAATNTDIVSMMLQGL